MNEIEKMYKNLGIKPRCSLWTRVLEIPATSVCEGICNNEELCSICTYGHVKHAYYPPFTTEKQIELIKFLMEDYSWYLDVIDTDNFENSLAASLNDLWSSLKEEEKQQIKEILE